ncbi:MAG: carbohydrate kinase family protein [Chloroflexia bacterium]|nr:carbohydrate kinase family protein [Chloroflexia bacterium]
MRVAAVGLASWDRLLVIDRHPAPGAQSTVLDEIAAPGGTTTNTCVALARLGAAVKVVTAFGDDAEGVQVRRGLEAVGVDPSWSVVRPDERTNQATVLVSREPPERTILWRPGAQVRKGDRLDIPAIFGHDLVLLDLSDLPLLRFLTDLPAHVSPRTRLLGTANYLADPAIPDRFELALRHDVLVGSETDIRVVVGAADTAAVLDLLQAGIAGANLRAAVVTAGVSGCTVVTETERWLVPAFPIATVDPTGAGDAFLAGVAWGMTRFWPWPVTARFAAAMGALGTRALGAQTSLPTLPEIETFLAARGDAGGNPHPG